jgi:hypothetical protein
MPEPEPELDRFGLLVFGVLDSSGNKKPSETYATSPRVEVTLPTGRVTGQDDRAGLR